MNVVSWWVVGTAAIIIVILASVSLARKHKIRKFQEYGRQNYVTLPDIVDVVLLGPRLAGKSSIVKVWKHPWTKPDPDHYKATEKWKLYHTDIHPFEPQDAYDPFFEVDRPFVSTIRIRIHDNPGELRYLDPALKELSRLGSKAVVLFVFDVGFKDQQVQFEERNANYYCAAFVHQVLNHMRHLPNLVAKPIVVFNKVDTLPREWDDSKAEKELKMANTRALGNIERLFGKTVEYQLTSTITKKGMLDLLGKIGEVSPVSQNGGHDLEQRIRAKYKGFL